MKRRTKAHKHCYERECPLHGRRERARVYHMLGAIADVVQCGSGGDGDPPQVTIALPDFNGEGTLRGIFLSTTEATRLAVALIQAATRAEGGF